MHQLHSALCQLFSTLLATTILKNLLGLSLVEYCLSKLIFLLHIKVGNLSASGCRVLYLAEKSFAHFKTLHQKAKSGLACLFSCFKSPKHTTIDTFHLSALLRSS